MPALPDAGPPRCPRVTTGSHRERDEDHAAPRGRRAADPSPSTRPPPVHTSTPGSAPACRPAGGRRTSSCRGSDGAGQSRRAHRSAAETDSGSSPRYPGIGQYPTGSTGSGKSHLAVGIARACVRSPPHAIRSHRHPGAVPVAASSMASIWSTSSTPRHGPAVPVPIQGPNRRSPLPPRPHPVGDPGHPRRTRLFAVRPSRARRPRDPTLQGSRSGDRDGTGGQLLFHRISRLDERSSVIVTTNLAFGACRGLLTAPLSGVGAKASWPLPAQRLR